MVRVFAGLLLALSVAVPAAADEVVRVGVIASMTGPGASMGALYRSTIDLLPAEVGGRKVEYVVLDDATDPSIAVKNARKLATELKVDAIVGPTNVPQSMAVTEVAHETRTPQLSLAPISPRADRREWVYVVAHGIGLMVDALVADMRDRGVKRVAYIGFSDAWGDAVHQALVAAAAQAGIEIVANERYARNDTSVTAQMLKIVGQKPDAVLVGASGTPGALPHSTLARLGYRGPQYNTHGVINRDFLKIGGRDIEGVIVPSGPVQVFEQLAESNPIRQVAAGFSAKYEDKYGAAARNSFAPYTYDAFLLLDDAVRRIGKELAPGTPAFRKALRDQLEATRNVVGTEAIYTMSADDHNGMDRRGVVLIHVADGRWQYLK